MKVFAKVEGIAFAIIAALVRMGLMTLGSYELFYEVGTNEDFCTMIVAIVIVYFETRNCVFKCIDIVKRK